MPGKRLDGKYTVICSHRALGRAKYRDALTRLPDHLVQRVYEHNLVLGRRDLANYAVIEAGKRMEARAFATFRERRKARGVPISQADMDALDAEWVQAYTATRKELGYGNFNRARQKVATVR